MLLLRAVLPICTLLVTSALSLSVRSLSMMSSNNFYNLKAKSWDGQTIDFKTAFEGKVVYGVNVASR